MSNKIDKKKFKEFKKKKKRFETRNYYHFTYKKTFECKKNIWRKKSLKSKELMLFPLNLFTKCMELLKQLALKPMVIANFSQAYVDDA
jgi:hypothetical protein